MKQCSVCDQVVSEKIITCPACGNHIIDGMKYIDDYRIQAIIHEGRSSIVCKAIRDGEERSVSIRVFTEKSGVDDEVALRLERELIELKKLPPDHFVQHFSIKKSSDGHWYRLSEWVDAMDWGSIFMSDMLNEQRKMVTLFHNIASVLELLHKQDHFMPYLILEDILIPKKRADELHVKINYKLSRFLNARATHHGPMLQKLLDCHPDIRNERAIDFKSGIWSLGKIFVELLTADPNLKAFSTKLDEIKGLDPDLKKLIKLMLSDDPDLRPKNMAKVVQALADILKRLPYTRPDAVKEKRKPALIKEIQWFKRVVVVLILIIVGIVAFGGVSWFKMKAGMKGELAAFSKFVEDYASSVAFIMVEYGLKTPSGILYKNKVEGTAFLADRSGYILTNRHVACPWLDDGRLYQIYGQATQVGTPVTFDYKIYLWFEGAKAFNRLLALQESNGSSDAYHLSSAYRTGGEGNLRIVGVPRSRIKTGQMLKSPFRNDYAVLKIDNLPPRLKPLPLKPADRATAIKRLSPVVILGFPLGNRTQADHINTSITQGHVRRSTKEIIQVDTSIYSGNSGGPAIDEEGQVIGIASGVVTDSTSGYIKINTPLSDFGLVLPIDRPAALIESIKNGLPQWNGVIDFSLDAKLEEITRLAIENQFDQAAARVDAMLEKSDDPALINVAGMLHFCNGAMDKAALYFKKLALIEQENTYSRLMLYIIDWLSNDSANASFTRKLFTMTWYEESEYLGYLATVLRDQDSMTSDFIDYENLPEKSWRLFADGLIAEKNKNMGHARTLYKESIMTAHANDWVYFLAFSRLNRIQKTLGAYTKDKAAFEKENLEFHKTAKENRQAAALYSAKLAALAKESESGALSHDQKMKIHAQMLEMAPENRNIIGKIAFYHARRGEWQEAIAMVDRFFKRSARQTSLSLSLGLLKGQLLELTGEKKASQEFLTLFAEQIEVPWYRIIIKNLLKSPDIEGMVTLAGKKPEKLITLHTALGLRAEALSDMDSATQHYKEALSSYLDDWNEYELALGRIMAIR